ncbi:MAG: energy-coupling factor transporter transmembrane component T [Candidatus Methanoperedens sp.]|nr:energy-coupling factor transporter transmembrane component T [Candidatus Methanoperedens sp.]
MLEWLSRDPLNGVIITVTFFISVIIGKYIRMKRTASGYRGKSIDQRIKLFILFFLIISITLMTHWYIPIGISILCILISIKANKFGDYSRKLIFPVVLSLFIIVIQGLTYGSTKIDMGIISIHKEGFEYGFLIFSRVFAATSLIILMLSTASETEILDAMRWYRIPAALIDISSLMMRYIKAFSTESRKMKQAQESRCGFSRSCGFREKMQNIASISGALIGRAFTRAEQVYRAMISRGWKPDQSDMLEHRPLNNIDMLIGFALSAGTIILLGIDRAL